MGPTEEGNGSITKARTRTGLYRICEQTLKPLADPNRMLANPAITPRKGRCAGACDLCGKSERKVVVIYFFHTKYTQNT